MGLVLVILSILSGEPMSLITDNDYVCTYIILLICGLYKLYQRLNWIALSQFGIHVINEVFASSQRGTNYRERVVKRFQWKLC